MSANPEMNVQMNGGLADSLLQVNQLSYRLPPQISIASKCTHVINYSQQSSYTSGSSNSSNTIVFDIQTGSAFVDPQASYFRFVVKPEGTTNLHCFGSGSVGNIFSRVVVRTATGKELSRVEDANLIIKMLDLYENSNDWKSTTGAAQGYYSGAVTAGTYAQAVPNAGKLFIIPFQTMMPCMSPHGAKLVPPNIMSGLRIELTLSAPNDAFCCVDQKSTLVSLASFVVDGVEAHLKTHDLADAFQRKIQEMSVGGMNYLFKEHFHGVVSPGTGSTNANFDVKKACSKAITARIMTRLAADLTAAGKDHMASAKFNYTSHQAKIGSDYFPNAPLLINGTPTANNVNEAYYYTLYAVDKLEKWNPTGVNPAEFLGGPLVTTAADTPNVYSSGIIAYNFNKSNVSDMAGYTISNSRSLLVDLQQANAENVRIDVFLTFLRLAKVYQSNVVVLD